MFGPLPTTQHSSVHSKSNLRQSRHGSCECHFISYSPPPLPPSLRYTVEFGTILERGEVRAFGAGLLSSVGELQHMKALADTWQAQMKAQELAHAQAVMPASCRSSSVEDKMGGTVSSSAVPPPPPLSSSSPPVLPLDPFSPLPRMSYKDGYQRAYFLCNSFDDVADKLLAYAASLSSSDDVAMEN